MRYLRTRLHDDRIDRRVLHGSKDMGDIYNIYAHGHEGVAEAKSYKSYTRADLVRWQGECVIERANADADFILLIVHEPGCGRARFGQNSCYVQVRDLQKVMGGTVLAGETALDMWVRLPLEDACRLIRWEGEETE